MSDVVNEQPRLHVVGNAAQPVHALAELPDLAGKVVLVTGGTDGVGRALVDQLAATDATVVLTARDAAKGARVQAEIKATTGNDRLEVLDLDLSSLASVRVAAVDALARWDRLDLLICNAGYQGFGSREVTSDGFEMTFGVNHLGHALLMRLLQDRLISSAPSRVIVIASEGHRTYRGRPLEGGVAFDDLMLEQGEFDGVLAYSRSKLANILFARQLAAQLAGTGVDVNSVDPGGVDTPMMRSAFAALDLERMMPGLTAALITPDASAAGILRVALDPSLRGTTGRYFKLGLESEASPDAHDDVSAARLWKVTEELVGLTR